MGTIPKKSERFNRKPRDSRQEFDENPTTQNRNSESGTIPKKLHRQNRRPRNDCRQDNPETINPDSGTGAIPKKFHRQNRRELDSRLDLDENPTSHNPLSDNGTILKGPHRVNRRYHNAHSREHEENKSTPFKRSDTGAIPKEAYRSDERNRHSRRR